MRDKIDGTDRCGDVDMGGVEDCPFCKSSSFNARHLPRGGGWVDKRGYTDQEKTIETLKLTLRSLGWCLIAIGSVLLI